MVQPLFENMPQLQGIWNKETFPAKIMEVENNLDIQGQRDWGLALFPPKNIPSKHWSHLYD